MEQHLEVQGFDFSILGNNAGEVQDKAREFKQWRRKTVDEMLTWGEYFLDDVRPLFGENGYGFKDCITNGFGLPYRTANEWMVRVRRQRETEHQFNIELVDPPEQARIPELEEHTQNDEKDRKLAELEKALNAKDEQFRSAQEHLFVVESQVAHYKQQAIIAQAQAAQQPKTIEKTIEKRVEVVPQHVLDRQKQLETRLQQLQTEKTQLQVQAQQIKKERDLYKRDLDKERQSDNALFLQNLEASGPARLHANFAEVMREIVAWSSASRMKLPSVVDTQSFEAEQWQRLDEAIQAHEILGRELHKLKNTVSSSAQQQSFIVDAAVLDTDVIVR